MTLYRLISDVLYSPGCIPFEINKSIPVPDIWGKPSNRIRLISIRVRFHRPISDRELRRLLPSGPSRQVVVSTGSAIDATPVSGAGYTYNKLVT